MNNEKGGIISNLFIIPLGMVLLVCVFAAGYYLGTHQAKKGAQTEIVPPLPDVASPDLPKQEEFTFYKTLTDKENRTVSIDLKPKPGNEPARSEKKQSSPEAAKNVSAQKERVIDLKIEKAPVARVPKETAVKKPPIAAQKTSAAVGPGTKLRYTLQIASYQDKDMAEDEVKKMKTQGYAAFVVSSQVPDKGTWYRVRLGSFSNKAAAEKLQKELLAKAGVSPIIVTE